MDDFNSSFDSSLNILYRKRHSLDYIFAPQTIAVIGASEKAKSVGKVVLWNLLKSPFGGTIYPINPKRTNVLGIRAYPSVKEVPEKIDLAVVVIPAKIVPSVIEQCAEAGIPSAIIISAGFKELGESGMQLEQQILDIAKKSKMRIIGPNCLGVMNPINGLNATFAADLALPGNIAFISQSGALCTAVLDWSLKNQIGFSSFVSIGSMIDVDWGDLIHYFGRDEHTKSILIYMESIGNPRSFLSAAREVAFTKPIILIKAGRTEESAKAAASHTGSLSGSDDVLDAALKRVGVLRVDSISDLFSMARVLSKQPKPKGPNLTVVTNAGGPGVIATDALIQNGGKLATLDQKSFAALNAILPPQWSRNNPIDILGDAGATLYAETIKIIAEDENSDGILVILTPQDMTDPTSTAYEIKAYSNLKNKPVLASWMGAAAVAEGDIILNKAGIPTFEFPDEACKAFAYMWNYTYNLKAIYQTPEMAPSDTIQTFQQSQEIEKIVKDAKKQQRTYLTEFESKKILDIYKIPTVKTTIATTVEEAASQAKEIGFPVVLKLHSETITHKTDVGGVKLNLNNEDMVKQAYQQIYQSVKEKAGEKHFQGVTIQEMISLDEGYELILGSSIDPQFGPILLFGTGGQLVEVFKDRSLALPPLSAPLARRMMERTKIYQALKGVRGRKPIDLENLENILVQFSNLAAEQKWIKECDINPLLVSGERVIALDARIILHDPATQIEKIPKIAIRPYPTKYIEEMHLKEGTKVTVRPVKAEDVPLMAQFLEKLSETTMRQRFLKFIQYDEIEASDRLKRLCFIDYDREIAIIVKKDQEILAVGRLTKLSDTEDARFAITIRDDWQKKGIGSKLMQSLVNIAKQEKIQRILAYMLEENAGMKKICEKFGFSLTLDKEQDLLFAELVL